MSTLDTIGVASVRESAAVIPLAATERLDDVGLLALYRLGDVRAFEMLFDRHRGRLRALSVRYLGDPAEADDVVQETFLRLLRVAEWVDGDFKVMAWLHRVAANLCVSVLRRRRRVQLVSGDEEWLLSARDQNRSAQPDEAFEMGRARELVVQAGKVHMRPQGGRHENHVRAGLGDREFSGSHVVYFLRLETGRSS